ncbi:MAG: glycoside hydrolase family 99-like domain-containing protein [Spirochaetes bacterium]|nr:glycoside hydrolase family 99-like domain-containing protein [Spirochaetota bacterium]
MARRLTLFPKGFIALAALVIFAFPAPATVDPSTIAHWAFDGKLVDLVSPDRAASTVAPARFTDGKLGRAFDCEWNPLVVPDSPDLRLAPGFTIDCWVYWDQPLAAKEQILVMKNREYLLRVSGHEGGNFAFFVNLGGWEPRVNGPIPVPGTWYHVVASWSGSEMVLDVNGAKTRVSRLGVPQSAGAPVIIGSNMGAMDEVRLVSPQVFRNKEMARHAGAVSEGERSAQAHFGGSDGWKGWQAIGGASSAQSAARLEGKLPQAASTLVKGNLKLPIGKKRYVTLDVVSAATEVQLSYLTDRGTGSLLVPLLGAGRSATVDLGSMDAWAGELRALGVSLPEGPARTLALEQIWVSEKIEGKPFVYARSLAPTRAALRTGREEQVVAVLRSLAAPASNIRATLVVPPGVTVLDGPTKSIAAMGSDTTEPSTWKIRAERAGAFALKLEIAADGFQSEGKPLALAFTPALNLPKAEVVPPPKPAKSDTLNLIHYCALWKEGTHYGWGKIEPYPERRPAIGWYNEGTPEVADWHVKMALDHGINGFIYCWYRSGLQPEIKQTLGHALEDGLMKSRYRDQFKFTIMWENGCADGVKNRDDLMNNLFPFWMSNYFKHPSYVKIDNKPLLIIWVPGNVSRDLGAPDKVKAAFTDMRDACRREGFDGLYIVGCLGDASPAVQQRMALESWDATTAYCTAGAPLKPPGRDPEGIATMEHRDRLLAEEPVWKAKKAVGALPDIVSPMCSWDPRPWHGKKTASYMAEVNPANFKELCARAKALIDATPGNGLDKRVVVFDNWNEFGEGHICEPCAGYGFGFLDAIKDVFSPKSAPCLDITPEDVGLPLPESVYLRRREILGNPYGKPRKVVDHLVAWWKFEDDTLDVCMDASACKFNAVKSSYVSAPGKIGKGFACKGGTVSLGASPEFYPADGITIDLWAKVEAPNQNDRWMLNTGGGSSGYRLGLTGGKISWQIPKTTWSHGLSAPKPLEIGKWVHIVATYDNQTLRLYQDGVPVGSLERGGPITPSDAKVILGSHGDDSPRTTFQGVLDEVKIYDRAFSAAEIAAAQARNPSWRFDSPESIKALGTHMEKSAKAEFALSHDATVETPAGKGALRIEVRSPSARNNPTDLQVWPPVHSALVEGRKYRISVLAKASASCPVVFSVVQNESPWGKVFAQDQKVEFTSEWKTHTMEAVALAGATGKAVRSPDLFLASVPSGTTLWIAQIAVEEAP